MVLRSTETLNLTGEEFEKIRNVFIEVDEDGDSRLTKEELKKCFRDDRGRLDEFDLDYMIKMMDLDQNGTVEFPEFLEMMAFFDYNKEPLDVQITTMFEALDKDQNGLVSTRDILILWNIFIYSNEQAPFVPSLNEVKDLLLTFELDQDGKIEYTKFVAQFDFSFMESKI